MVQRSANPYRYLPHVIFLMIFLATLGIYTVQFLITFLTFDDSLFQARMEIYITATRVIAVTGILAVMLYRFSFSTRLMPTGDPLSEWKYHGKNIRDYLIFAGLLLLEVIIRMISDGFYTLNFIIFLVAVYVIFSVSGRLATDPNLPSWHHPTTFGGIIESSAALGLSAGIWLAQKPELSERLAWLLLAVLMLEILTLWGRLYYLSRSTALTRASLRIILGSHVALFGIRFIFGLIMPIVYLFWSLLFSKELPFHPVILMVIVGEISERILFYIAISGGSTTPENIDQTQSS